MTQDSNISMVDAKRIAKANGYKAGAPISEFQIIQIVSAGYSAGIKAATAKDDKAVLTR